MILEKPQMCGFFIDKISVRIILGFTTKSIFFYKSNNLLANQKNPTTISKSLIK